MSPSGVLAERMLPIAQTLSMIAVGSIAIIAARDEPSPMFRGEPFVMNGMIRADDVTWNVRERLPPAAPFDEILIVDELSALRDRERRILVVGIGRTHWWTFLPSGDVHAKKLSLPRIRGQRMLSLETENDRMICGIAASAAPACICLNDVHGRGGVDVDADGLVTDRRWHFPQQWELRLP